MGETKWYKTKHPRIRHYSPPKFGWKPPALSADTESKPIPRVFARKAEIAYSDAQLGRIHSRFSSGGGIISILMRMITRAAEPPPPNLPPDLPDDQYSVEVR